MFKCSSAKYYENTKERLQKKKLLKDIKVFLRKEKKKSNHMVPNNTKIYQKMKNKSLLSIVKNIIKCKQYKNLSEDEKQKFVKYSKKYYKMRKKCLTIIKRNYYIKKK